MRISLLKELKYSLHCQNNPYYELLLKTYSSITAINGLSPWSSLFSTPDQNGLTTELAFYKASKLLNSREKPNSHVLAFLIRVSTDMGFNSYSQTLHCCIVKSGFISNVFVSNSLVRFYRLVENVVEAHKLFVEIPEPNVVSWNSLISGYVHCGLFSKSLELFVELERSDVCANSYSFTLALNACGQLGRVELGREIHCMIVKCGSEFGVIIGNCLIDMYGKCGMVDEAILFFCEMSYRDNYSWNSVIAACARNCRLELAYGFFSQMPQRDTISYNEMISGISQFGDMEDAVEILSKMPNPNSSSWNSIITGFVNRNRVPEALVFFDKMHSSDLIMDVYTFSVILSGVANIAALRWGMLIHGCSVKWGLDTSVVVGSALIDMYAKCGQMKNAESMFQSLPEKNLVTWNAMFSGYAHNSNSSKAMQHFEEMGKIKGLEPDCITFLNVIAACSNSEVPLQTAFGYLDRMINDYGIEPTIEHCCTMIRLLGQRDKLWRAGKLIYGLEYGLSGIVWKALLGACGASRDCKVASIAAAKVIVLKGENDHVYVMMSNLYAHNGKWADVSKVRKVMREKGVRKDVGYSWIEGENIVRYHMTKTYNKRSGKPPRSVVNVQGIACTRIPSKLTHTAIGKDPIN